MNVNLTVGSSLDPAPVQLPTKPTRQSRAIAYHKLFVPLDAVPSDGDLDETMPASAALSPQLTVHEVADIVGYSADLIRRANGAGPYFQDDLNRLYWRTRKLWHEGSPRTSSMRKGRVV